MRKKKFQYGIYTGKIAVLWWVEVHLFKWLFKMYMKLFFAFWRFLLFIPNLIGKTIDKLIWVIAEVLNKEYTANIAEKMLGYPYRLYDKTGRWWKNLIYGEQVEPKIEEHKSSRLLKEPEAYDDDYDEQEEEEVVEEFPFCQIFRLGGDKDLHIMKVEYCPDETAFIRVVSNDSYTKPYKRKVQRDKQGKRFILFNGEKFYLDPKRTQPRMPE